MFSMSEVRIRHLVEQKVKHSELLLKLKNDSHKLLITILIGNNIANIGGAAIVAQHLKSAGANVTFTTVLGDDDELVIRLDKDSYQSNEFMTISGSGAEATISLKILNKFKGSLSISQEIFV